MDTQFHHNGIETVEHGFIVPELSLDDRIDIQRFWNDRIFGGLSSISGGDTVTDGSTGATGTNERADVIWQTLDGADLNSMWAEFNEVLRMRNEMRDRLVNYFTYQVVNPIEQVRYPTQENFEEATEYGEPKGIRLGQPYNMGFSFRWYDLAIRYTWQFILESSQAQVEALQNEALEADDRLIFQKVFKAILNPLDELASVRNIPVTVYKFWNGDGISPPFYKNFTFDGSHNHYITSGAASLATAGLKAMEDHLYHHGYSVINGYTMALIVNRQEGFLLRAARVVNGWEYDFIPGSNVGGGVIMPASLGIVGAPENFPASGGFSGIPTQIGTYGPWHVIEEDYVPAGYVIGLVSKGPENLGNPVGIRHHENPNASGLKLIPGDSNYPLKDSYYRHGFGTGIRHRGGGVIMQVTASGSYTVPAAYA